MENTKQHQVCGEMEQAHTSFLCPSFDNKISYAYACPYVASLYKAV